MSNTQKGFAKGVKFDRDTKPTEEYLQAVLTRMKENINLNTSNLVIEAENAAILERFFNALGTATYGRGKGNEINLPEEFQDELLYKLIKSNTSYNFKDWKFNKEDVEKTIHGVGFEKYVFDLVQDVMKRARSKGYVDFDLRKGGTRAYNFNLGKSNVSLFQDINNDIIEQTVQPLVEGVYKQESNRLRSQAGKANLKSDTVKVQVEGKVDIGFNYSQFGFTITGEPSPGLKKVLELLSESSFSAKSYKNVGDVALGQTNSFRVFMATTEGSTTNKVYHWYRMLTCLDNHLDHKSAYYFYQIRYIYELTGYGQSYVDQKINEMLGNNFGAKYLIYYNPGKGVRVLSTAVIINNFLQDIKQLNFEEYARKYEDKYSGNSLKNYALGAKLKLRMSKGWFELY